MGRQGIIRAGTLLVWMGFMGWLLRYEAFPQRFDGTVDGYARLLPRDALLRDSWMRVLFQGRPIGYSYSSVDIEETDPVRHYKVAARVQIGLKLMGQARDVRADTLVALDVMYRIQSFAFDLHAGDYAVRLKAVRDGEEEFSVSIRTGASSQRTRVKVPPDVVIFSPMTELALMRLKPGESITLRTLDPATMATAPVTIKALRRERITVAGASHEATVLSSNYQGLEVLAWMGADGDMLRQDTPFGWTMEKCTPDEAYAAVKSARDAEDLLRGLSVPCRGRIDPPRAARELRYRLSGVPFTRQDLNGVRQTVESLDETGVVLTVRAASAPPADAAAPAAADRALQAWLAATPSVQSDHEEIRGAAADAVRNRGGAWDRARALHEWVHRSVRKEMTISLPSALDVLRTLKGDCNEHTYLFVALARAAGLPAKIVVGLAYHDGAFYYHAWPAVHVGEWVEMDPTWGQETVDATHLALAEGELADQIRILKVMGQLKIEVLD